MRHLPKQFHDTPKLVVTCGLGNIRPKGSTFTSASADTFTEMVDGKILYARILKIDTMVSMNNPIFSNDMQ